MKPALRERLERLTLRASELDAILAEGSIAQDLTRFRQLLKEQSEVSSLIDHYRAHQRAQADGAAAQALLASPDTDAELRALAEEELEDAQRRLDAAHAALQAALLPKDPDDARAAFIEIRAGTGGDESALFAGDLVRMYLRYFERRSWRTELISSHDAELGGYKEWIARIDGEGVYGRLRFESGGHRVQRIPETESQGRIHTSACTVAVMPEADAVDEAALNPADLRIDTFRASGAGGQHINKTDSAVRVTHLPTGLVAECQDDRSQHRNKAKALQVLAARLRDRERQARESAEAATRKGLVGSGERSDRIRTYNFPQGRLTDHRINLTLYKLGHVMEGDLDDVLDALQAARAAEQLAALEAGG